MGRPGAGSDLRPRVPGKLKLIGEELGLYLRKHVGGPVAARKSYDEAQLRLVTANDPVPPAGKVTVADQFEASIAGFSDWLPTAPGRDAGVRISEGRALRPA